MKEKCTITYLEEVENDLDQLSDELLEEYDSKIQELMNNIHLGKPLTFKNGKDLRGCYKIFFDKARYRIVYRKIGNDIEITGVEKVDEPTAEIIAVGPRKNQKVYEDANIRINR